jgi:hypothetical protein
MKNFSTLLLVSMVLIIPVSHIQAKEDKELQKQRQAAQKERQAEKDERNREMADTTKSFREFTHNLKNEYPALLKEVDTEFELKQVDLQAERDAKIAQAEAEYQKKVEQPIYAPRRGNEYGCPQRNGTGGQSLFG